MKENSDQTHFPSELLDVIKFRFLSLPLSLFPNLDSHC